MVESCIEKSAINFSSTNFVPKAIGFVKREIFGLEEPEDCVLSFDPSEPPKPFPIRDLPISPANFANESPSNKESFSSWFSIELIPDNIFIFSFIFVSA